jgi:hypothetical protein
VGLIRHEHTQNVLDLAGTQVAAAAAVENSPNKVPKPIFRFFNPPQATNLNLLLMKINGYENRLEKKLTHFRKLILHDYKIYSA